MSAPGETPEPSSPAKARASRTTLTGSLRRGLFAWRDAVKRRDVALALAAIALSTGLGALVAARDRALHEAEVGARARRLHTAVAAGLERPLDVLLSLQSLYLADPNVTRQRFRFFVAPLLRRNRHIYALEWMPLVSAAQRPAYEAEARAAGLTDYRFWGFDQGGRRATMGPRPEYGPIHFMEPPNLDALGFDIEADPFRWETARWARDTGQVAASRRFALIEDAQKKETYSVVIYQPVFRSLEPPGSPASRRTDLRGFLLAVFRLKPLLEAAIAPVSIEGLRFALWDPTERTGEPDLLFESEPGARDALMRLHASTFC